MNLWPFLWPRNRSATIIQINAELLKLGSLYIPHMARPVRFRNKWRIRWFDEHGVRHSEVYDHRQDAQFALRRHEGRVEEVKRGLRPSMSLNKTFNELCDYYLAHRSPLKRRKRDDESLVRTHLRPFFGKSKISELVDKIDEYKSSKAHYHANSLNHQLTLLISMLRLAHEKRWLLEVPHIKKPRVRVFDKDFHYLKTEQEIKRFLLAAEQEGEKVFVLFALATYTGLRPGEQAALRKDDIILDRRLIAVQNSYDGPTKNGEVRYVPILDPLLPVLRKWMIRCQGPILIPNEDGNILKEKARIFDEVFKRVLARAKFPNVEKNGKLRSYIRYYDLRHTFASHWMRNGGDIFKLSKILGHKSVQMTMRYAHLQPDVYAEDYARLGTEAVPERSDPIQLNGFNH